MSSSRTGGLGFNGFLLEVEEGVLGFWEEIWEREGDGEER